MKTKDIIRASECRVVYWNDFYWRGLKIRKTFYLVGRHCYSMGILRLTVL